MVREGLSDEGHLNKSLKSRLEENDSEEDDWVRNIFKTVKTQHKGP